MEIKDKFIVEFITVRLSLLIYVFIEYIICRLNTFTIYIDFKFI